MSVAPAAAIERVNQKASQALEVARGLTITTQDGYVSALEMKKGLKAISAEIDATFDPVIESAHKAHKDALAAKKKHAGPVDEAMEILTTKTTDWDAAQERIRRAEETRLREIARRQEEERRLAEAQAREEESRRLRAEQERLAKLAAEEAAKGRAEAAELARMEAEQRQVEADAAQAESEQALHEAVTAEPPVISLAPSTPQVEGVSYSKRWDFQITDEKKIPREYLLVDSVKIRRIVTAMKDQTNIPGVRVFSRNQQAMRG